MANKNLLSIEDWHLLFDRLCNERGYRNNGTLASELGKLSERGGAHDYEASLKSVHNWREGKHLPQKRNFALLTRMLAVDKDRDLLRHWNELYAAARGTGTTGVSATENGSAATDVGDRFRQGLLWLTATGAAFFAGFVFAAWLQGIYLPSSGRTELTIKQGETALIHAGYGDCGGAPDWNTSALRLPNTQTGVFLDGGTRTRFSIACGGFVKTRAIQFMARTQGEDKFALFGVSVRVEVE
ncbi:hypothetical protein [Aquamicrobium terrae]|uniref:Uncharacterized protein n=1 Tax=Aquamicrobium terrae TaxID=1324945 RepID=A0ABV2MW66_9HYPH